MYECVYIKYIHAVVLKYLDVAHAHFSFTKNGDWEHCQYELRCFINVDIHLLIDLHAVILVQEATAISG